MKIVISESQYKRLIETDKKPKILEFPSLEFFDNDPFEAWKIIQKIIERKGNPPYSIDGDLNLAETPIESLGNLQSVGGSLFLNRTPIESLGNLVSVGGYLNLAYSLIKSLGNLQSVGGELDLEGTPIESLGNLQLVGGFLDLRRTPIESLGNLKFVGGYLDLQGTPLFKKYTKKQIREIVNVGGDIYL